MKYYKEVTMSSSGDEERDVWSVWGDERPHEQAHKSREQARAPSEQQAPREPMPIVDLISRAWVLINPQHIKPQFATRIDNYEDDHQSEDSNRYCECSTCLPLINLSSNEELIKGHKNYKENAETIKEWLPRLPQELQDMIIFKTLPATIILQFMPHKRASQILLSSQGNPDTIGDEVCFSFDHGVWTTAAELREWDDHNNNKLSERSRKELMGKLSLDYSPRYDATRYSFQHQRESITPLCVAARVGNLKALRLLLNSGAITNYTTVACALVSRRVEVIEAITNRIARKGDTSEYGTKYIRVFGLVGLVPTSPTTEAYKKVIWPLIARRDFEIFKLVVDTFFWLNCVEIFQTIIDVENSDKKFSRDQKTQEVTYIFSRVSENDIKTKRALISRIIASDRAGYFAIIKDLGWLEQYIYILSNKTPQPTRSNEEIYKYNIQECLIYAIVQRSVVMFHELYVYEHDFSGTLGIIMRHGCPESIYRELIENYDYELTLDLVKQVAARGNSKLLWEITRLKVPK